MKSEMPRDSHNLSLGFVQLKSNVQFNEHRSRLSQRNHYEQNGYQVTHDSKNGNQCTRWSKVLTVRSFKIRLTWQRDLTAT